MRHRVFTYITRENELLVLEHVDHRYLDPQIPGGTIKENETPEIAAIREAQEETGLKHLQLMSFLGSFKKDLSDIGRDEVITAWFFHLLTKESTPSSWRHFETDPSEGAEPIEFELYWVPISNLPKLGGIDDAMLRELKESLLSCSVLTMQSAVENPIA